eukprot:g14574.t1
MRPRQDWCSSLGAQAQNEEAPLMELAKWGLAVVARIVEDTHKVYDEYASFPVYWKQVLPAISAAIKKGEPYMHQPKHKLRRTQPQLAVDGQWVQLYVPRCLHGVRTPVCSLVPRGVSTQ